MVATARRIRSSVAQNCFSAPKGVGVVATGGVPHHHIRWWRVSVPRRALGWLQPLCMYILNEDRCEFQCPEGRWGGCNSESFAGQLGVSRFQCPEGRWGGCNESAEVSITAGSTVSVPRRALGWLQQPDPRDPDRREPVSVPRRALGWLQQRRHNARVPWQ